MPTPGDNEAGPVSSIYNALQRTNQTLSEHTDAISVNVSEIAVKLPMIVTTNAPARTLDSVFQPSLTNPCLVSYTVELEISISLGNPQEATVDILSDASSPPATSHGQAKLKSTQLLGLSVSLDTVNRQQLTAYVPAGNYVKLSSAGTGTATLISQLELEFTG